MNEIERLKRFCDDLEAGNESGQTMGIRLAKNTVGLTVRDIIARCPAGENATREEVAAALQVLEPMSQVYIGAHHVAMMYYGHGEVLVVRDSLDWQ